MGKVYIISDLHLGHENLAKHRGFDSAEQQDSFIIERWNSYITTHDVIYILGDIAMENRKNYHKLDKMNGIKKVVGGNHDLPKHLNTLLKHVNWFSGMFVYRKGIIMTHAPIHPSQLDKRYKLNIHGHVHVNSIDDYRYRNVSAEVLDYAPMLLEDISWRFEMEYKKPWNRIKRWLGV